jgi:MinD-like ATPase involved in chromosome partitioning or flagellar assembly
LRPQARILLADMVFPLGTIARMIGLQTPETLAKLTHAGHGRYDAALVNKYISPRQRWGWRVLTSASGLDEAQALEVGEIAAIFETLGTMFDYLFVDLGRSLSRITLPIMQCAAIIAVILTPDINTVALTKTSLEYLFSVGITPLQLVLINNRTIGRVWISKEEIEKELSLPLLGTIPFEAELFTMAINAHVPFVAKYPEGAASMMFTELANQLLARAGQ